MTQLSCIEVKTYVQQTKLGLNSIISWFDENSTFRTILFYMNIAPLILPNIRNRGKLDQNESNTIMYQFNHY